MVFLVSVTRLAIIAPALKAFRCAARVVLLLPLHKCLESNLSHQDVLVLLTGLNELRQVCQPGPVLLHRIYVSFFATWTSQWPDTPLPFLWVLFPENVIALLLGFAQQPEVALAGSSTSAIQHVPSPPHRTAKQSVYRLVT